MNSLAKTARALLTLLPAVLLTVQCSQKELSEPEKPQTSGTVTLTIRNTDPTKTSVDGETGKVYWNENDYIFINYDPYAIIIDENDPTVATVPGVTESDSYFVVYTGSYPQEPFEGGGQLVYFPNVQSYAKDSFSDFSNIAAGYSASTDVRIYNIGGIVRFGVTGNLNLTSLSFSAKDGSPVAGWLQFTEDQLASGEFGDSYDFYANTDYGYYPNYSINVSAYTQEGEPESIALGSEPTDFYVVVPAGEYAEGFYITLEDSEGNVAYQFTTGAKSVGRSEMLVLPDFGFTAQTKPEAEVTDAGPTSITYTVTAASGIPLKTVLVSKAIWDYYASDSFAGEEEELARQLAAAFGSETFFTDGEGKYVRTDNTSFNVSGNEVALTADTQYKLIVSFADNVTAKGTPAVFDVSTGAPEGEAPEIDLSEMPSDRPFTQLIPVIRTTNAAGIKFAMFNTSAAEEQTDEELLELYGAAATAEQIELANSQDGLKLSYGALEENSSYTFLVEATGAGGHKVSERLVMQTDYYIDPEAAWSTVTTQAEMLCDIFTMMNFGEFLISGLTVEKMDGQDFFRVLTPFTPYTFPEAEEIGLSFIDEGSGSYLTIDATDHSAVKIERAGCHLGFTIPAYGGSGEARLSSASYYYDEATFGTYYPETGEIHFGQVSIVDNMYVYGVSAGTVLHLNIPAEGGGISTEDFTIRGEEAW